MIEAAYRAERQRQLGRLLGAIAARVIGWVFGWVGRILFLDMGGGCFPNLLHHKCKVAFKVVEGPHLELGAVAKSEHKVTGGAT